jgi:hypothetical protein
MVTEPGFSSPNQPDQERTTAYRHSSGPESLSDAHCATIIGDWEKPSGESGDNSIGSLPTARREDMKLGKPTILNGEHLSKKEIKTMRTIAERVATLMAENKDIERMEVRIQACYLFVFESGNWMIICIKR